MFFRRPFFFVLFALLLLFGLFSPRQRMAEARFEAGYAAGYAAGAAATGESAAPAPAPAPPTGADSRAVGAHWGPFALFGILGFFFKLWLTVALFGFLMMLFRRRRWRRHGRPAWGHHRGRGPWHDGHDRGPWRSGGDATGDEKQPEDIAPDVKTL